MDENAPQETPPPDSSSGGDNRSAFNKIDLTQLQGFSFGTQWTQDKGGAGGDKGGDRRELRPHRDDRRPGPGGDAPADRRDRRAFRRPDAPAGGAPTGAGREGGGPDRGGPGGGFGGPRREFSGGGQRPRGDFRGGPRSGPGGERPQYAGGGRPGGPESRMPYDSPYFSVTFYPEDTSFNALVKTVRASCRTIELFEIARTVLGKAERFTVLLTRRDPQAPRPGTPGRQPAAPVPGKMTEEGGAPDAAKEPIYLAIPDSLPFESEEAAISHVLSKHLASFFDSAEVEVEPPKGNFQVINRCGVTGELLGPPNYHRYNQIVQQHYAAKGLRVPFEAFKARIESVRDQEVVNQWLEKMKKVTRYTSKLPVAEGQTAPTFDAWEDARIFVLTQAKDKMVRPAAHARFHGREVEKLPPGEIHRAIEGTLERQRRFPLDTANALRGRLRREHFTIFKKGAKGVSYVCAVKRKFRTPGQMFAESIGTLISFVESHPMVKAGELPKRFLGLAPENAAAPAGAEADAATTLGNVLSVEQREKIARMQGDLLWLVREGYVTEFIDGALYAPPPMVEARKKEVEREEVDPENFPERPGAAAGEAPAEAPMEPGAPTEEPPLEQSEAAPSSEAAPEPSASEEPAPESSAPTENAAQPAEGEGISAVDPREEPPANHRSAVDAPAPSQSPDVADHSSAGAPPTT